MSVCLYSLADVAQRLSVCVRTVRRLIRDGLLPVVRLGRGNPRVKGVRVRSDHLERFIASMPVYVRGVRVETDQTDHGAVAPSPTSTHVSQPIENTCDGSNVGHQ